jgi:hypothetical protein
MNWEEKANAATGAAAADVQLAWLLNALPTSRHMSPIAKSFQSKSSISGRSAFLF